MNTFIIPIILTVVLGLYSGSANAHSFVAGAGTQTGTVADKTTNLMWQKCSNGLSGVLCETGPAASVTWDNALAYCEAMSLGGFVDWRLPNLKELISIIDMGTFNPAIHGYYFPGTVLSNYWSSTSFTPDATFAWTVNFDNGYTEDVIKTSTKYVRCVREQ